MTNLKLYPMKMIPAAHTAVWGGDKLKRIYNKKAPFDRIAESWELSARSEGESIIENGSFAGMCFGRYLEDVYGKSDFPLLIKFIDSAAPLSIQVHPADIADGAEPKTEMWYIIDAAPEARIVYGLRDGVSLAEFAECCKRGGNDIEDLLNFVPVRPGDTVFIPAGQIHSIGAGILLAEIQQNSDTTYRLYDYGRVDAGGNARQLHIEKGLAAARLYSESEIYGKRFSAAHGAFAECIDGGELLADCEFFRVIKHTGETAFARSPNFTVLLCTEGCAKLICEGTEYPVCAGDTYFIPPYCEETLLTSGAEVISAAASLQN